MLPGGSPTWQGKVATDIVFLPPLSLTPSWFPWQQDSVLALLSMLSSSVNVLSKDDVKTHTSLLLELFTTALDYRATQANVGCIWNHESLSFCPMMLHTCLASYREKGRWSRQPWQPCVAMTTMVITCQPWSWQDVTNLNHWYYFQPASFPILIPQLLFPCSTYKYPIYLHSWSEWRPANKANSFRHVNVSQYCVDLHCIGVFISSGGGGGVLSTGIHQPRRKALRSVLQTHVPQGTH